MDYNDLNAKTTHASEKDEFIEYSRNFNFEVLLEFLAGMAWKD